mmetsp:Transcript_10492/g.15761  ORF Transcript_10492/g.15761 Transcript_10492/m.15761 type:complete len:200 (-) Transcript_10492:30-629(-)
MVQFHFSPVTPDEDFLNNVQTVNNIPNDHFASVAECIFGHLSAENSESLAESVVTLAGEMGVKPPPLQASVIAFLIFFNGCTKYNLNNEQIKEDLVELGVSEDKIKGFMEQWMNRHEDLYDVAVAQSLRVNELVDMEWSFGVASSSKEVKKLGSAFLRLKLVLDKGGKIQTVYMEMTLPQFYEFIHEMEVARAQIGKSN